MSHDRGCFKCGRDVWEYDSCPHSVNCVKRELLRQWANDKEARDELGRVVPKPSKASKRKVKGPIYEGWGRDSET